jgi:hypothetical protein
MAAASRRIERENERRLRTAQKVARYRQKMAEIERAQAEVEDFEETIVHLTSFHRHCGESMDWDSVLNSPPPIAPDPTDNLEQQARIAFMTFRPSFLDRIFGRTVRKRVALEKEIERAIQADLRLYDESYQQYVRAHEAWNAHRRLAHAILSGDTEAYEETLTDLQPFIELTEHGCEFNHTFRDSKVVQVAMTVDGRDVVPSEGKSLTSRGQVSLKSMPQSRFNGIYQDYVCGAILRVAREFFAVLPLNWVCCTAYTEMLNPATGHIEVTPIVSVNIPRATMCGLNFDSLDASDAMTNFTHQMRFKKSAGFSRIDPLNIALEDLRVLAPQTTR